MNSFIYHINRYTAQLNLAINQGWQFNQEGAVVTNCQGKPLTKTQVLDKILSTLRQAPLYYAHGDPLMRFLTVIESYADTAGAKEKKNVEKVATKINEFIYARAKTVISCFQGEAARKVNVILDKKADQLQEQDYILLKDLANYFAFKRQLAHIFYQHAAIIETIRKLRKECPDIRIIDKPDKWTSLIDYQLPKNVTDIQFALFVMFQFRNNKKLACIDIDFLREVIQRKAETQDVSLQKYLNSFLRLHAIGCLCEEWDRVAEEKQIVEELDRLFVLPPVHLNEYTREFIHEPLAYRALIKTRRHPFGEDKIEYGKIAKELSEYNNANKEFDQLYTAIYEKIKDYQTLHPEANLPHLLPNEFVAIEDFIGPADIKIPVLTQIRQWEKEAAAQFALQKKSKPTVHEKPVSEPTLQPVSVEPELIVSSPPLVPSEEIEEENPPQEKEADASPTTPVVLPEITSLPIPTEISLKPPEKLLDQLLIETSPFQVKERIINWFIPGKNLPILNQESSFIHNFAWAANDILWQFGLRYPRKNDEGIHQPAIAMLCQTEHAMFLNSEVFHVTATFDHTLKEEETAPSRLPFSYNPSWLCYHRALTRRPQNENVVDEYLENGKNQFIDFPPLPSQRLHLEFPRDLLEKKYPDGSFIESSKGSIITIRDPKHDTNKKKCRLHFFVVR